MPSPVSRDKEYVEELSRLTLGRDGSDAAQAVEFALHLNTAQRQEFVDIANSHHVVIRALTKLQQAAALGGKPELADWASEVIAQECARIDRALPVLDSVCKALEENACPATVIKSLDHWPDLGNDLDLYTTGEQRAVVRMMMQRFKAKVEARSWGDRLARKWNFAIPELRESVEVHCQRLGQTGEHTELARRFVTRRVYRTLQGYSFPVPAPEERVIVATLQRMYRHFYFRLSDIVNTAALLDTNAIDLEELRRAAELGGIWPGVATYLRLVSDYTGQYRGTAPELPMWAREASLFGGQVMFVKNCFIRVPVIPHGAQLYTRQVTRTALRGDVPATFRLSLLPPLASVAAVAYKLTGSDKGIW